MGKPGPRPKAIDTAWTPELAYVVGIFASDGNLGKDGMYLDVTSTDKIVLENVLRILDMQHIRIGKKSSGHGTHAFRIQFKRVSFHTWLRSIGLSPNKSKTLGALEVPDKYFFDFLRGVWDGDGCVYSFWDKRWRSSYMFYIAFASASPAFLTWLQTTIFRLADIEGKITSGTRGFQLRYAKRGSRKLFDKMFERGVANTPYLKRKFTKAREAFSIDERNAQKWGYK